MSSVTDEEFRKKQTRRESLFEQVGSTAFLMTLTFLTADNVIYPLLGVPISSSQNLAATFFFAAQNTTIRYIIRRKMENKGC